MKNILTALIALILILSQSALAEITPLGYLSISQAMAQNLTELCSCEAYGQLYSTSEEILDLLRSWGGDWASPAKCKRAAFAFLQWEAIDSLWPQIAQLTGLSENASTPLRENIIHRFSLAIPTSINSASGVTWIAASSVAQYSELRFLEDAEPGIGYVLMDYGAEHPKVLCNFFVSQDGAASLGCGFIALPEEMEQLIFSIASGEMDFQSLFTMVPADEIPFDVTKLLDQLVIQGF